MCTGMIITRNRLYWHFVSGGQMKCHAVTPSLYMYGKPGLQAAYQRQRTVPSVQTCPHTQYDAVNLSKVWTMKRKTRAFVLPTHWLKSFAISLYPISFFCSVKLPVLLDRFYSEMWVHFLTNTPASLITIFMLGQVLLQLVSDRFMFYFHVTLMTPIWLPVWVVETFLPT